MVKNFYGMPISGPMNPIFLNSCHHYDYCDHYDGYNGYPFGPTNSYGPRHIFSLRHSFAQSAPVKSFPYSHFDHFLSPMNIRPSPMHNVDDPFGHHENFKKYGHHEHRKHHKHHGHHKHHDHDHRKHHKYESNNYKFHNYEHHDHVHREFPVNKMKQACYSHLKAPSHILGNGSTHPLGFNFYHFGVRRFGYHHLLLHHHLLGMKHYHLRHHHRLVMKHYQLRHHHRLGMKYHLHHYRLLKMKYHLIYYYLHQGKHFDHPLELRIPFFKRRCHFLGRMHHFKHNHSLEYMKHFKHLPLMHSLPPFGRRCHSLGPENRHTSNSKLSDMHRSHSLDSLYHNPCSRRSRSLKIMNQFTFPNIHHCGHRVRRGRSLSPKPVSNNFIYDHPHYKRHNHKRNNHKHHDHKHHKHNHKINGHCKNINKCNHQNVDILEDENNYYIYTNLYGINKENLKINYNKNNVLTISDKQKQKSEIEDDNEINESHESHENEKNDLNDKKCRKFKTKIDIPGEIDPKSIKAKYWNGKLEIVINKATTASEANETSSE